MVKFFVMSVVDLTVDGVQAVINLAQQYQELQQELLRAQQLQPEEEKDEELSLTDKSLYDFILDQSKIELRSDDVYSRVWSFSRLKIKDAYVCQPRFERLTNCVKD